MIRMKRIVKSQFISIALAGVFMIASPFAAPIMPGDDLTAFAGDEKWDGSVDISWFTEQPWGMDDTPWTEAPDE